MERGGCCRAGSVGVGAGGAAPGAAPKEATQVLLVLRPAQL